MGKFKKVLKALYTEYKERGFYIFLSMNISNLMAILRSIKFRILYPGTLKSTYFFIQSRSKMDIFNKKSKVIIKPFVFIRRNVTIRVDHKGELTIGEKAFINDNCSINCINKIQIGDYAKIGPNVSINDNDHNFRKNTKDRMLIGEVLIGKNVWIGANTVILRNTKIGDNAVIAAGSVVKGDIPANSVYRNKRTSEIIQYDYVGKGE